MRETAVTPTCSFLLVRSSFCRDTFNGRRCKVSSSQWGRSSCDSHPASPPECCLELAAAIIGLGLLYDTDETSPVNCSLFSLSRIWLHCLEVMSLKVCWISLSYPVPLILLSCSQEPESPAEDRKLSAQHTRVCSSPMKKT